MVQAAFLMNWRNRFLTIGALLVAQSIRFF